MGLFLTVHFVSCFELFLSSSFFFFCFFWGGGLAGGVRRLLSQEQVAKEPEARDGDHRLLPTGHPVLEVCRELAHRKNPRGRIDTDLHRHPVEVKDGSSRSDVHEAARKRFRRRRRWAGGERGRRVSDFRDRFEVLVVGFGVEDLLELRGERVAAVLPVQGIPESQLVEFFQYFLVEGQRSLPRWKWCCRVAGTRGVVCTVSADRWY
mmetsp:Transcript_16075/g.36731  ORF Transcript_16075/g.36731 Transcript_16075/m.36731 type:complete len:207 (-) Transcript_16075:25-645(-)